MKRFVSLFLCVCLACGLCMTAFADSTPNYPPAGDVYGDTDYDPSTGKFSTTMTNFWFAVSGQLQHLMYLAGHTDSFLRNNVYNTLSRISTYNATTDQYTKSIRDNLLNSDYGLLTIGQRLDTLNNKVSTAENQVSMQDVLEAIRDKVSTESTLKVISTNLAQFRTNNWNKVMQKDYSVFTWNSTDSDWYVQSTKKTTNTFNDSFNSAMLSLLNGIASIANVVASPEDQLFSYNMNASQNKQNLSNWNQLYGQAGSSDALGVGSLLTDNLTYMDSPAATSEITNFLNGSDDSAWKWFSQETYDDLDPSGTATLALDDDSIESVTPPPDDVVYFIDPDFTAADLLNQIKERNK